MPIAGSVWLHLEVYLYLHFNPRSYVLSRSSRGARPPVILQDQWDLSLTFVPTTFRRLSISRTYQKKEYQAAEDEKKVQ